MSEPAPDEPAAPPDSGVPLPEAEVHAEHAEALARTLFRPPGAGDDERVYRLEEGELRLVAAAPKRSRPGGG